MTILKHFLAKKQQTINAKNKIEYITLHIKGRKNVRKLFALCSMLSKHWNHAVSNLVESDWRFFL